MHKKGKQDAIHQIGRFAGGDGRGFIHVRSGRVDRLRP
jgi:hypothetical protein